jgi:glycine/D-amino acid oxidase-like deaminating enzyme
MASANIVICGAGIAGISVAYQLAVKRGVKNVVLVDDQPPLSVTSDKSTECYRNWWPGPGDAMVSLMNHSIDILENLARESGNAFHLNRRGYFYATAQPERVDEMKRAGEEAASLGAGAMRVHTSAGNYVPAPLEGFENQLDGSDLILDREMICKHFPFFADETLAVMHARRCGWLSAQTLGMYLLEQARERGGILFVSARVEGVDVKGGAIKSVRLSNGTSIDTEIFIIAAGPQVKQVGKLMGVDLPVFCELHTKVSFRDDARVFPRDTGLLIWTDSQYVPWSDEERSLFAESAETRSLLDEFPSGAHARSEGSANFIALWSYHTKPVEPTFPIQYDSQYPEIAMRGLATMLPALRGYFSRLPKMYVDGGYYCKTQENRPLIGALPVAGAYICAAMSGYGVMASCGAGDLLAARIVGEKLPPHAWWFELARYQDPEYQKLLQTWGISGQL